MMQEKEKKEEIDLPTDISTIPKSAEGSVEDFIGRLDQLDAKEIKSAIIAARSDSEPLNIERMCLLDTFSLLAFIMLPTNTGSDLLAARMAALAGKGRLKVSLKPDEDKSDQHQALPSSASIIDPWSTLTSQPYSLAVALSHGSGITYNYDQTFQDKLCPNQSLLTQSFLAGVVGERTFLSTHIHTLHPETDRVVDNKTPLTAPLSFSNTAGQQVRVVTGAEVPFIDGTISDGKGSYGCYLGIETLPTSKRSGAVTLGLEPSAPGYEDHNKHTHLFGSAAKVSIFSTGPKINNLDQIIFDDHQQLKSKRDSLRVDLSTSQEAANILKMDELPLKRYAVGMLLGMDRAVDVGEYQQIFSAFQRGVAKVIPLEQLPALEETLKGVEKELPKEPLPPTSRLENEITVTDQNETKTTSPELLVEVPPPPVLLPMSAPMQLPPPLPQLGVSSKAIVDLEDDIKYFCFRATKQSFSVCRFFSSFLCDENKPAVQIAAAKKFLDAAKGNLNSMPWTPTDFKVLSKEGTPLAKIINRFLINEVPLPYIMARTEAEELPKNKASEFTV